MPRIVLATCLLFLTLSCAKKDAGRALLKLSAKHTEGHIQKRYASDSSYYIGYVDYFPETHEFYTSVFFREGHEYPDDDLLTSRLDSVIVYDDDWGRERLPMEEADKWLVLDGLDTLAIYNRKHETICRCPLTRIEYVWNGLESYFVAVFRAADDFPGQSEELYGISAGLPEQYFSPIAAEELKDNTFNDFLLRKLELPSAAQWEMRHYRITPGETMYSVLSSWSHDGMQTRSYLTYFERNKAQVLNEEVDNFHYLNILPVPVFMNGKPLMLVSAGYPSSDVLWDFLAGFDGTAYEAIDYNRIHVRDISQQWNLLLSHRDVK